MEEGSELAKHPTARLAEGFYSKGESTRITTVVLISLSLYNSIELVVIILSSFKHYKSIYFWALLLSNTLGVLPYSIGTLLDIYSIGPQWLMLTALWLGFSCMVPGQSIVLYSRLHLVVRNGRLLTFLRLLIVIGTIVCMIPITVLYYGSVYIKHPWNEAYAVMERLQLIYFCSQEGLLSTIFIVETINLIRLRPVQDHRTRILYELVAVNLLIIVMDIALLLLEFLGFYFLQVILKGVVYSIKLKLEFAVLGRLQLTVCPPHPSFGDERAYHGPDHFGRISIYQNVSHAKSSGIRDLSNPESVLDLTGAQHQ
ncbi:hypothetical protein ABOM_006664 [Aspergillus bombycis]|uniref:DUF7703 domain-containing protein n=1 Tax=Aspergillus bombycis TaxID=109264 RepID=A0A1F8A089_9EURO|nr:hypothetical protein ABOM_006664 [Aspergillus bombycis]OGM45142.1 hypothetical protein ABOM_006664 [Aspergillus bombycis]